RGLALRPPSARAEGRIRCARSNSRRRRGTLERLTIGARRSAGADSSRKVLRSGGGCPREGAEVGWCEGRPVSQSGALGSVWRAGLPLSATQPRPVTRVRVAPDTPLANRRREHPRLSALDRKYSQGFWNSTS